MALIWVSSPYGAGGANEEERQARYDRLVEFCDKAYAVGLNVFSPIMLRHVLVERLGRARFAADWWEMDKEILRKCDVLWVLQLDGWQLGEGVLAEIEHAKTLGIEIRYVAPDMFDTYLDNEENMG